MISQNFNIIPTLQYANWDINGNPGPHEYGSKIYTVTSDNIIRSLDGGTTWTAVTNDPFSYSGEIYVIKEGQYYYISYRNSGSTAYDLDIFDMADESLTHYASVLAVGSVGGNPICSLLADGKVRIVVVEDTYTKIVYGDYTIDGAKPVSKTTGYTVSAGELLDAIHSVYSHADGGMNVFMVRRATSIALYALVNIYISPAGVVSAPQVILADCRLTSIIAYPLYSGGVIYLPFSRYNSTSHKMEYVVAKGSTSLTAPTWTTDVLTDSTLDVSYGTILYYQDALHVFGLVADVELGTALKIFDWVVTSSGHEDPTTIFEITDTFYGVPTTSQYLHIITGSVLSNGNYIFNIGVEATEEYGPSCSSMIFTGLSIASTGQWEFWEILKPDIVQVLPIARRFDQLGPEELFRYGKIDAFEYRVLPLGTGSTSTIPFEIFFNDDTSYSSTITVTNSKEKSYHIGVPKGTAGAIVRIEFGPTTFDFHRFYIRILCSLSGKDTELNWIALPREDQQ